MKRRKFTSKFKTKVVLEALSERYTLAQLAERHKLHPNQISQWKSQFLSNAEMVFDKGIKSPKEQADQEKDRLLKTIGQLKVENDFLNKALR
jgi:transposase